MSSQNIQIMVRVKSFTEKKLDAKERKETSCASIQYDEERREVTVNRSDSVKCPETFTFDKVFGVESSQIDVYEQAIRPVVIKAIEGHNCTIIVYGQTGTGKTFTMEGGFSSNCKTISWDDNLPAGIIPRSVSHLFSILELMQNCEHSVKVSFIDLYNEELTDLLSEQSYEKDEKLKIYDDCGRNGSVMIAKLVEVIVQNKEEVNRIFQRGSKRRQKASTLMNSQSSRSHSIFTVTVFIKEKTIDGEETIKEGKLNLVDLAGSENIERSGSSGKRAAETGKINQSLTALGRVTKALVEHRDHIPYRESNLTRLLQDSLGGKSKTLIIGTISQDFSNQEGTLSTLNFTKSAKLVKNNPTISQKLLKEALTLKPGFHLKQEIVSLRSQLNDKSNELDIQKKESEIRIIELNQNITDLQRDLEKSKSSHEEYKTLSQSEIKSLNSKLVGLQSNLDLSEQKSKFNENLIKTNQNQYESKLTSLRAESVQKTNELNSQILDLNSQLKRLKQVTSFRVDELIELLLSKKEEVEKLINKSKQNDLFKKK